MFDLTSEHAFDKLSTTERTHVRVTPEPYGVERVRAGPDTGRHRTDEHGGASTMTISASTQTRVVVLLTSLCLAQTGVHASGWNDSSTYRPACPDSENTSPL